MGLIIGFLIVVLVVVCVLMVFIVMMQRPKQEGLGAAFGAGMANEMFGAQTTNVLQKGTTYLGTMFFGLTLLLAILTAKHSRASLERDKDLREGKAPAEQVEETPALPGTTPDDAGAPSDPVEGGVKEPTGSTPTEPTGSTPEEPTGSTPEEPTGDPAAGTPAEAPPGTPTPDPSGSSEPGESTAGSEGPAAEPGTSGTPAP